LSQSAIDARELGLKATILGPACATADDELERIALAYAAEVGAFASPPDLTTHSPDYATQRDREAGVDRGRSLEFGCLAYREENVDTDDLPYSEF
jgi:hypothetical protein